MNGISYAIDRFSVLKPVVMVSGWAFSSSASVTDIEIKFPSGCFHRVRHPCLPSPDVAAVYGAQASHARFDVQVAVDAQVDVLKAELVIYTEDGGKHIIKDLAQPAEPIHWLLETFLKRLADKGSGRLLEVGSRARSGIVRRDLVPKGWSYTGLDVMRGENVDVVGDAHKLSSVFPKERFDGVMSFSVLEHLMMPWKFAVELNKVLNVNGLGILITHQCWPIHDAPWDFWRFSDSSWASLFNRATGFEIIQTALGEPAYVVAQRCHPATNFSDTPGGFLASGVLFHKVADTKLEWPVEVEDITDTSYPATTCTYRG